MAAHPRLWPALAALSGLIGVAGGAFGAHGAATPLAKELLRTGADYELVHTLAVFACLAVWRPGARLASLAAWLFLVGSALFSWSLYGLAVTGQRWLGLVTPFGGLLFLAGWATLAVAAFGADQADRPNGPNRHD
jgi:uncharacterized membrane protein YgdD (TMEM256/DUF423 family)